MTQSFRELAAAQPDLVLEFVSEAALKLGCPSLQDAADTCSACSASPERPSSSSGESLCSLQKAPAQAQQTPDRQKDRRCM